MDFFKTQAQRLLNLRKSEREAELDRMEPRVAASIRYEMDKLTENKIQAGSITNASGRA